MSRNHKENDMSSWIYIKIDMLYSYIYFNVKINTISPENCFHWCLKFQLVEKNEKTHFMRDKDDREEIAARLSGAPDISRTFVTLIAYISIAGIAVSITTQIFKLPTVWA